MKKILIFLISTFLILDIIDDKFLNKYIHNNIINLINKYDYKLVINEDTLGKGKYVYKEYNKNIKNTSNYIINNKEELLNIYYTMLNNGYSDYSFYCNSNYENCLEDINEISNNPDTFTLLNQIVHPYNSFYTINSKYNKFKKVDIDIEKKYNDVDIEKIENKMDEIINNLNINSYESVIDKIRVFHDYLANNNEYDVNKESNNSIYHSDTAIGPLFEGYSICSGYSDTLSIFLNKLNLDNVKVATDNHVWNAVKIDNVWYHIDLTWDDPIISDGSNTITHDYFMITTSKLLEKDPNGHNFNKEFYYFIN